MIAETMTVVRTHGPRDYRVEEIPVPSPGPGEVLIEVDACGICASDMKCWLGGELFMSEAQIPQASTSMRISPGPGDGTGISSTR